MITLPSFPTTRKRHSVIAYSWAFTASVLLSSTVMAAPAEDQPPERSSDIASGVRSAELVKQLRELDRRAQIIKEKSLDIDHAIQAFVDDVSGPSNPTRIFLSVDLLPSFTLTSVRIDIDGNTATRLSPTGTEAASLRNSGVIRLIDKDLTPGNHEIWVEAHGERDSNNGLTVWKQSTLVTLEVGQGHSHVDVNIKAASRRENEAALTITALTDEMGQRQAQLYRREALHLQNLGQPMRASTTLQRAADKGFVDSSVDEANLQLGKIYAQYGLHYLASAQFHKLADRPRPFPVANETWLRLAEQQFRRGQLGLTGLVEYTASRMRQPLSDANSMRRTNLLGELYLAQQRYPEAGSILKDQAGPRLLRDYAEYNRAVSMINTGETDLGAAKMDSLGKRKVRGEEQLALKDLANLSLAYYFLDHKDAGSAIPLLKRIRTEGPFSNKALLALGWAELGESGRVHGNAELIAAQCANNSLKALGTSPSNLRASHRKDSCAARGSFKRELTAETNPARFRSALKSWLHVRNRNPIHPAVQETLLAIPFGLLRTDKVQLARQHYQYAIDTFAFEAQRLENALDAVEQKKFITAEASVHEQEWAENDWRIDDISPQGTPDLRLLYRLIARHDFYEALINFRNLSKIQVMLEQRSAELSSFSHDLLGTKSSRPETRSSDAKIGPGWQAIADTSTLEPIQRKEELERRIKRLKRQVSAAMNKHSTYLHAQAADDLNLQRQRLQVYSARARIALARIFDDMLKAIESN